MSKKALRLDEIGYWSELKLEIVKKYASAYSTILARQSFAKAHLYIDAFAGAGTHVSKATGEAVAGSPVNAMAIQPPFSELHFIDMDGTRTAELRRIRSATDPDAKRERRRHLLPVLCVAQQYRRQDCQPDI